MKKIIYFLIISLQFAYGQWEKTSWRSAPYISDGYWAADSVIVLNYYYSVQGMRRNAVSVSTDYGKTFREPTEFLSEKKINCALIFNDTILAGGDYFLNMSADWGQTWTPVENGLDENFTVNSLFKIKDKLYLCSRSGLFVSKNGAKNWTREVVDGASDVYAKTIAGNKNRLFLLIGESQKGGVKGLYVSDDYGNSWTGRDFGLTMQERLGKIVFLGDKMFIGTDNQESGQRIFVSTDRGDSWRQLNSEIFKTYNYNLSGIGDKLLFTKGGVYYVSTDFGETWTLKCAELPRPLCAQIDKFVVDKNKIYASSGSELLLSTDSASTWQPVISHKNYGPVASMALIGNRLYAGTIAEGSSLTFADGVFYSEDDGATWTPSGLEGKVVSAIAGNGDTLFAATNHGFAFSMDKGKNWTMRNKGLSEENDRLTGMAAASNRLIVMTYDGVYYSDDFGENWGKVKDTLLKGKSLQALAYAGGKLFVGAHKDLFLSEDMGTTWINISANLQDDFFNLSSIAVQGGDIYLATSDGIYYSGDMGDSWELRNSGINWTQYSNASSVYVKNDQALAAVANSGVYSSNNKGRSWKKVDEGIKSNTFHNSFFAIKGEYAFLGTNTESYPPEGDAIYHAPLSDLISVPEEPPIELSFHISPNPADEYVELINCPVNPLDYVILNSLGLEARKGEIRTGKIDISFLPPGVYYIRIGGIAEKFIKI